jgi:hypothetical protein
MAPAHAHRLAVQACECDKAATMTTVATTQAAEAVCNHCGMLQFCMWALQSRCSDENQLSRRRPASAAAALHSRIPRHGQPPAHRAGSGLRRSSVKSCNNSNLPMMHAAAYHSRAMQAARNKRDEHSRQRDGSGMPQACMHSMHAATGLATALHAARWLAAVGSL